MNADINTRLDRLEKKFLVYQSKVNSLHNKLISQSPSFVASIDDEHSDLFPVEFIDRSGNNESVILSFGAILLQPFLPPAEFKRTIMKIGIDAFFIKDFYQCWYQKGLLGIANSIPETVPYLQNLITKYQRTCAIGTSSGGYGAIVFGVELKVQKIIAFSPQTILNHNAIKEFSGIDTNLQDIQENSCYFDLINFFINRDVESEIDIYYGMQHERDVYMAERLKHLPFINLHPINTNLHNVARFLKDNNRLDDILKEAVDNKNYAFLP
jgi:hypothetical protein